MHGVLVAKPTRSRAKWLAVRRQGIGGSDISAILGLSKFKTPYTLWLDKMGYNVDGEQSQAAFMGNVLEPTVARLFKNETGHRIFPTPGTLQHPEHQWMLVNPDRLVCDKGEGCPDRGVNEDESSPFAHLKPVWRCTGCALLECKTTSAWKAEDWEDGELPEHALLQVQWALHVTGLDRAYVAGLIGGQDFKVVTVERDDELIALVVKEVTEFWRRVVENDPPDIDGHGSTTAVISKLYNVDPDKTVELPATFTQLRKQRDDAAEALREAEEAKKAIENQIRTLFGDAEVGMVDGEVVATWKQYERKPYFVEGSTYRSLKFKKEKASKS